MKKLTIFLILLIFVGCLVCTYHYSNENISTNEEYTPSENLAIIEGRFDDAKKSIQRREILDGK